MPDQEKADMGTWPRYTLTAFAGLVAGLMATYSSITISNQSRIAAVEAISQQNQDSLRRIETKLDKLTKHP